MSPVFRRWPEEVRKVLQSYQTLSHTCRGERNGHILHQLRNGVNDAMNLCDIMNFPFLSGYLLSDAIAVYELVISSQNLRIIF